MTWKIPLVLFFPVIAGKINTAHSIEEFLNCLHLSKYISTFQHEDIDLDILRQVSEEHLWQLSVGTWGQKILIINAAQITFNNGTQE